MDADGRDPRDLGPLSLGPEPTRSLSWSPDGRKLAFTNAVGCEEVVCKTWEVWTVDVRTGARHRVTRRGRDPAWAPTSDRLVYNGDLRTGETAKSWFWTTKLVIGWTTGPRERTLGRGLNPVWAPRGNAIAFERGGYLWLEAHGHPVRVAQHGVYAAWSPDGRRIAYLDGLLSSYVAVVDRRTRRRRTFRASLLNLPPTWSAKGDRLAWEDFKDTLRDTIVVACVAGGKAHVVLRAPAALNVGSVAWSPRGRIYFTLTPRG
jgi:Tol biopolymer transport system component